MWQRCTLNNPSMLLPSRGCDSSPRSRFFYLLVDPFPSVGVASPPCDVTSVTLFSDRGGGGADAVANGGLPTSTLLPPLGSPVTSPVGRRWVVRWAAGCSEVNRWMINKVTASAGVVRRVRTTTRRSRDVCARLFLFWGCRYDL
jgi:hypothetical protein